MEDACGWQLIERSPDNELGIYRTACNATLVIEFIFKPNYCLNCKKSIVYINIIANEQE